MHDVVKICIRPKLIISDRTVAGTFTLALKIYSTITVPKYGFHPQSVSLKFYVCFLK